MKKENVLEKLLNGVLEKVDMRSQPDPEEAKGFSTSCSRRYINVGILTYSFYRTIADGLKDDYLRDQAAIIKSAVQHKDALKFEVAVSLFKNRLNEMGAWKSVKGLSHWQKVRILAKLRKVKG